MKNAKKILAKKIWLPALLLIAVLSGGGCLGGGGGSGSSASPIVTVSVESFALADWSKQRWQMAGNPDGEIHPFLPLAFEMTLDASRPKLSTDDTVWVALHFIENEMSESETDDDRYLGLQLIDLEGGAQSVDFHVYPETTAAPGRYAGIQAQVMIPGGTGELSGSTLFAWIGEVELLDSGEIAVIDPSFAELTINANPPIPVGTEGFDFSGEALADPVTGFRRLFGDGIQTTAAARASQARAAGAPTGYYVEASAGVEIFSETGEVGYIEIKERNGLQFWNEGTGRFEPTFIWTGGNLSNPSELLDGEPPAFRPGFPRGLNGVSFFIGGDGTSAPIGVPQLALSMTAYDRNGNVMNGAFSNLSDATLRLQSARSDARGNSDVDYPLLLVEDDQRVDLPVSSQLRRIDFTGHEYRWTENMTASSAWAYSLGQVVDYMGDGIRYIYGSEVGDKEKFAARAYALYEEYNGLAQSVPLEGEYSIHDVLSVCGTRAAAEVAVWIVDSKFVVFGAGAEFRNDLYAKIATRAEGGRRVVADAADAGSALEDLARMESRFNSKIEALGMVLLYTPMYANNATPFEGMEAEHTLFSKEVEAKVSARFFAVEVAAGVRANFYVKLILSNNMAAGADFVRGTGEIALRPGVDARGFVEAGINVILFSVALGVELRFVDFSVGPVYRMDGQIRWANGTNRLPTVWTAWNTQPRLEIVIKTLDGAIYVEVDVLALINAKKTFFSWTGYTFVIPVWTGNIKNRPPQSFELRVRN